MDLQVCAAASAAAQDAMHIVQVCANQYKRTVKDHGCGPPSATISCSTPAGMFLHTAAALSRSTTH